MARLHPNEDGTPFNEAYISWNEIHPGHPLIPVYKLEGMETKFPGKIDQSFDRDGVSFLWVGILGEGFHAAILVTQRASNQFRIIHSQISPLTNRDYFEDLTAPELMNSTLAIYAIK
jgi:hypothetical protein